MSFIKEKKTQLFILMTTTIHLWLGSYLNLTDDGAYYWVWSRHLGVSYYDHPPMIAYMIRFFTSIFGNNNFAVRLTPVLAMTVTSIFIYKIIMYLYNDNNRAFLAVIIFNVIPIFSMLSIMALPDLPLLMFYTIGLYYFIRTIYEKKANLWYIVGIMTGLGLLSKYNMFLIYPGIFLYLVINKKQRFWFKQKELYISFLLSLIFFLPVIIWNIDNNWASFAFHLYKRHGEGTSLHFNNFIIFFIVQLIIISPLLFIGFIKNIFSNIYKKEVKILFFYGAPIFFVFLLASLLTDFKVHWTALAYIPFLIIYVRYNKATRFWNYTAVGLAIFLSLFLYAQSIYPVVKFNPKGDITTDFHGWDRVGQKVQKIYNSADKDQWFLFSNRYQVSSQLYFYLPQKNYVYSINNVTEQYDFWKDEEKLLGKNGIFVTHSFYKVNPDQKYNFDKIKLIKKINITRAGTVYRTFYIYKCFNFQGVK